MLIGIVKGMELLNDNMNPFDMKFDLKTDDKMYCSEFVAKSINKSITPKQIIPTSSINHFSFIGIDDITAMPFMQNIFSKKYINQ